MPDRRYFNPLPPHGGRRRRCGISSALQHFNPLPPHGGRHDRLTAARRFLYFNPLPPHGGRLNSGCCWKRCRIFQSTPSAWRETWQHGRNCRMQHISIHSLRMEGDYTASDRQARQAISIHSLRMEGDKRYFVALFALCISIHSLRMEGDVAENHISAELKPFQSTPSAWRETAKLHRKAFFISPILVQSCKKGCKRLHSAPEKMVFFEKREKNLVRNLQHLSVRL